MKKVTIYSSPTCIYCNLAKTFLKANGIDYTDRNVASDLELRKEMIDKTGQMGIPVIEVDGQIVIGYNEAKLRELLGVMG